MGIVINGNVVYGPRPEPTVEVTLGYGLLYNWYAATDVRGVAPSGFRVPDKSELDDLSSNLTALSAKSDRLIADGEPYWNTGGDNTSGFTAFPGGERGGEFDGAYSAIHSEFNCWSNEEVFSGFAYRFRISGNLNVSGFDINKGYSIRCISDTEPATTLVQDNDGNNYSWVQIGSQYWLQQSLKTTTYNNGDAIATGLDDATWAATTDGAWAYPNGDDTLPI